MFASILRQCASARSAGELIEACCTALAGRAGIAEAEATLRSGDSTSPIASARVGVADGSEDGELTVPIFAGAVERGELTVRGRAGELGEAARELVEATAAAIGLTLRAPPLGSDPIPPAPAEHEFLLNAIPAFVWYKDTRNQILRCNEAAARSIGKTVAEVEGARTESYYPDEADEYYRADLEVIRSGEPRRGIVEQLQVASGEKLWIRTDKIPFRGPSGEVEGIIAFAVDITELKEEERRRIELEKALHHAQKMEALGRLAGGVAHGINNMLTPIITLSELVTFRLGDESELREDIVQIGDVARRAASLVRELLHFGRQEVRRPRPVDLAAELSAFEPILRSVTREDIDCSFRFATLPGVVFADPAQLEIVVMNLATNAQDAMLGGGELIIETSEREIGVDDGGAVPAGHWAVLKVQDNGLGMDERTMACMFEPFFTTKPRGRGTGLGLATVHTIVMQHGGHINVSSSLEDGTCFEIFLPLREGEPEAVPCDSRSAPQEGAGEAVLVVEDEDDVRGPTCRLLERHGYRAMAAGSAIEALELAREPGAWPDLLLTDVVLEGESGVELADRMRSERPGLRVLFMSGYASDVLSERGVLQSGIDLVQKPFAAQDLLAQVRRALA